MKTKSGKSIFPIGIGTWGIGGILNPDNLGSKYSGAEPSTKNKTREVEAIRYSISRGQNHLDCAEMYGGFYADEVVGEAISGLTREDLFIADKLWKTSVGPKLVRPTVKQMLGKLGTTYLDMLYIHYPWGDADWLAAIPQIDELIDEGVVRHLGVSNFTVADMKEVQSLSRHPIAANQIHFSVLHRQAATDELRQYCAENGTTIVAYRPVERGEVSENDAIRSIAETHRASPAQVSLAWLIETGALPIPKAVNPKHIDDNLQAATLTLSSEEIKQLDALI